MKKDYTIDDFNAAMKPFVDALKEADEVYIYNPGTRGDTVKPGLVTTSKKLSDWDFVLDFRRGRTDDPDDVTPEKLRKLIRERSPDYAALDDGRGRLMELGMTYQEMLAFLVGGLELGPTIVETGVRSGISTRFLLLATATTGTVHSIDPMYRDRGKAEEGMLRALDLPLPTSNPLVTEVGHWTFYGKRSIDCLLEIATATGGWDVFVHDSDHGMECQTFELEFGWSMLKPGGLLVCDDHNFPFPNGNAHGAFATFLERRDLECNYINGAAVVQKGDVEQPAGEPTFIKPPQPSELFKAAVSVAVTDQSKFDPGTIAAYTTYLEG